MCNGRCRLWLAILLKVIMRCFTDLNVRWWRCYTGRNTKCEWLQFVSKRSKLFARTFSIICGMRRNRQILSITSPCHWDGRHLLVVISTYEYFPDDCKTEHVTVMFLFNKFCFLKFLQLSCLLLPLLCIHLETLCNYFFSWLRTPEFLYGSLTVLFILSKSINT